MASVTLVRPPQCKHNRCRNGVSMVPVWRGIKGSHSLRLICVQSPNGQPASNSLQCRPPWFTPQGDKLATWQQLNIRNGSNSSWLESVYILGFYLLFLPSVTKPALLLKALLSVWFSNTKSDIISHWTKGLPLWQPVQLVTLPGLMQSPISFAPQNTLQLIPSCT